MLFESDRSYKPLHDVMKLVSVEKESHTDQCCVCRLTDPGLYLSSCNQGWKKMFNFQDAKFKETKFPTTNEFYIQNSNISLQFPKFPATRFPNSTFFSRSVLARWSATL